MTETGKAPNQLSPNWRMREESAQLRVDEQMRIVARFEANSNAHRTAIKILLLYQDALYELKEAHALLAQLRGGRP